MIYSGGVSWQAPGGGTSTAAALSTQAMTIPRGRAVSIQVDLNRCPSMGMIMRLLAVRRMAMIMGAVFPRMFMGMVILMLLMGVWMVVLMSVFMGMLMAVGMAVGFAVMLVRVLVFMGVFMRMLVLMLVVAFHGVLLSLMQVLRPLR